MYTKNCQNAWTKSKQRVKELRTSTVGPVPGLGVWGWGYVLCRAHGIHHYFV